ncbi:MAG: hypothetical protein ACREUT_02000 [Steroidobacteraceae bacterium]
MRTRLMLLIAGFGLTVSAAAGAANNAAPTASAAAPAAVAAPAAAAPAARAAPAFSGGGARPSGGRAGHGFHGARAGAVSGRWAAGGRGGYGIVGRGSNGMAGRRAFEGARVAAGGTRAMAFPSSGTVGYHFISASHSGAASRGRGDLQRPPAVAPQTASAAHAVRVVEGLRRRPGREVRPLKQRKDGHENQRVSRPTDRPAPLPFGCATLANGQVYCQQQYAQNGCVLASNGISYCAQNVQPAEYCLGSIHGSPCPPVLMPQPLCVEPGPTYQYRRFECARAFKMRVRD